MANYFLNRASNHMDRRMIKKATLCVLLQEIFFVSSAFLILSSDQASELQQNTAQYSGYDGFKSQSNEISGQPLLDNTLTLLNTFFSASNNRPLAQILSQITSKSVVVHSPSRNIRSSQRTGTLSSREKLPGNS